VLAMAAALGAAGAYLLTRSEQRLRI